MAILAGAVLACSGGEPTPEERRAALGLAEVPQPNLEAVEVAVRQRLQEKQASLERLLGDREAPPAQLAEAYGDLARHYHAYQIYEAAAAGYANAGQLAPEDFRWTYYHGIVLQSGGDLEGAADAYRRALELRPQSLPARVRLGEALFDSGEAENARGEWRRALELDSSCALAHYFLGRLESSAGEAAAAAEHFERALEIQPEASKLHYSLAQSYRQLGRRQEAEQHLAAMGNDEVRLADPLLRELQDLQNSTGALLRRAGEAQIDGAYDVALAEYRRAVAADPKNPEARQGLGGMLARQGELEAAAEQYAVALELDSDNVFVHYNLGGLLARVGSPEDAISHFESALALDPGFLDAYFGLARVHATGGRYAAAAAVYRRVLERQPGSVQARLHLGVALARQGLLAESREQLDQVLELDAADPEKARAWSQIAALAAGRGSPEEAVRHYERAIRLAPELAEAHFGLANLLGSLGRLQQAGAAYRRVLELEPDNQPARLGEATALVLDHRYAEARRRLEEGLARRGDDPRLAHTLARLLATCPDAAVRDGARALELATAVFEADRSIDSGETVAMALAEVGRFEEAADWQRRLLAEAEKIGQVDLVARLRHNLEKYERREPARS